jgi:hypothetical protein
MDISEKLLTVIAIAFAVLVLWYAVPSLEWDLLLSRAAALMGTRTPKAAPENSAPIGDTPIGDPGTSHAAR